MRTAFVLAFSALVWQLPELSRGADQPLTGVALAQQVQKLHGELKYVEALQAIRQAAGAGDRTGQLLAGAALEFGWGVTADAAAAAREYEKLAAGDGYAALVLGQMYARGGPNLKPDKSASEKWLAVAAQQGFRGDMGDASRHPAGTFYQAAADRRAQAARIQVELDKLALDWQLYQQALAPSKYTPRTIEEFEELRKQRERNVKLFSSPADYLSRRIKLLDEAVAADPTHAAAWQARGLTRWKEERYEDNVRFDPLAFGDPTAREKAKRLSAAQDELLRASALDPDNYPLHQQIVELAELRKDTQVAALHRGLMADSRVRVIDGMTDAVARGRLRMSLANDYFAAGRWQDLLKTCDALRKDLASPEWKNESLVELTKQAARYRGLALVALGKSREAADDLKIAGLDEPAVLDFRIDRLAPSAQESLEIAKRRYQAAPHTRDDLYRAVAILNQSIVADPKLGEAFFHRARIRMEIRALTTKEGVADFSRSPEFLKSVADDLTMVESLKFSDSALADLKRTVNRELTLANLPARIAATREATQKLIAENKLAEADAAWQALVEDAPERPEARLARLEFLMSQASSLGIEVHKQELTTVLALLPDNPARRGELGLGRLQLLYGRDYPDRTKTVREYEEYRVDLQRFVTDHEQLAWIAFDCKHYADAHLHLAQRLADVEPKSASERSALEAAGLTTELARLRRQVQWLDYLNAKPEDAAGQVQLALAWALAGDDLQGDLELIAADIYAPKSVLIRCWAANRRIAYGNYEDAQKSIDEALALDPQSTEAHICRGALRQAQCRFDDALADFERASQLGRRPEGYQRKAQIMFYRGQLENAYEALATALLIEPPAYSLHLPVRLAEPLDSAKASVVTPGPPNSRISSQGKHAADVAAAQLKLARGDLEGAESDLASLGEYAARWRQIAWTRAPQASQTDGLPFREKIARENAHREQLQNFEETAAAERKSVLALCDDSAELTLGLVRATWDEDQEVLQLRDRPLAGGGRPVPRMELAYWNFVVASQKRDEARVWAGLVRSVGMVFDSRKPAEYRAIDGPFRHVALYRRSRLVEPAAGERQPPLDANARFQRAVNVALSPVTCEDCLLLVRALDGEIGAAAAGGRPDYALVKLYDAQLLSLAERAPQLPARAYADPLLPTEPNHTRFIALRLVQTELAAAAQRLGDAPEREKFTVAAAGLHGPLREIMNSAAYQAGSRALDRQVRAAQKADEAREPLAALRKLAAEEHAEACYLLGMLYYVGTPAVPGNGSEANAWLQKGADLGHVRSQAQLGAAYLTGGVVRRDLNIAEKWLSLAAAAGDAQAKKDLQEVAAAREFERASTEAFAKLKPENLDASIQADPKNASLYERRAVNRLLAGQDDLALQDAEKVIELRPDDDDGYALRFIALTFLGREAEAQKAKDAFVQKFGLKEAAQLDQGLAELKKARGK